VRARVVRALLLVGLGAWLVAVIVIAISRGVDGRPRLGAFASTPDLILHGHLWTLLTSALPVGRYPAAEIVGLLIALYGVWRVSGIVAIWVAGLTAHIGCTLVVYAGIALLWLADRSAADPYTDRLDYGISAVWLGALGYLTAVLWPRNRPAALGVGLGSLLVSVALLPVVGSMATAEHVVALGIGVLVPMAMPGFMRRAQFRTSSS
jgi:hypothetical protein